MGAQGAAELHESKPSPVLRKRTTAVWISFAAVGAAAALYAATRPEFAKWVGQLHISAPSAPLQHEGRPTAPVWIASAPGRVEPSSGEVRIDALTVGRVAEVLVNVNDRVNQGDLLVRLEEEEAMARLTSVEVQVAMREREREGAPVTGPLAKQRKAEDKVAASERALAAARRRHDRLSAGHAAPALLAEARGSVVEAKRQLERARDELARTKAGIAKIPGPLDSALGMARAELSAAEALFEKTRVRSPFAGTILQLNVRVGEVVVPQRERPLALLADISQLRVRADLDERNWDKVRVGQSALVRSENFADALKGKVVAIAPAALAPAHATSLGRRRTQESRVIEVLVEIADPARLLSGMQVDVFFLASDAVP